MKSDIQRKKKRKKVSGCDGREENFKRKKNAYSFCYSKNAYME